MPDNFGFLCLIIYIGIFIIFACKARMFQWLGASLLLWLGIGFLIGDILPGVAGITHFSTFYAPQFYITVSSIFFFIHKWHKIPGKKLWASNSDTFISLFAVSGALMQIAFICLLFFAWLNYPQGLSSYILPALLQMYAFEPIFWVGMQILMMLLFYFHRILVENQKSNIFSLGQLQSGFLLALLYQTVWVTSSILHIRY